MQKKEWFWCCLLTAVCLLISCRPPNDLENVLPAVTETAVPALSPSPHPLASPSPHPPTPSSPNHLVTVSPPHPATPTFPIYNAPPLAQELLGIQVHLMERDQDEIFRHLQTLGVGWVKVQISWKLYEPEPGKVHNGRFIELDQFVNRANQANINVLLSVSKAPEWSRPTTEMDGPPTDFALFNRFMADLAGRYQGQVAAYELWNEPNLQREWNGFPLGGAEFAQLLRAGAAGVRAADAEVLLIAGAPAVTGIDDGVTAVADRSFLRQMLEAGAADAVDGLGVHPYGFANPPDSSLSHPDSTDAPTHNNHPTFFFTDTLNDYTHIQQDFGVDLPLWVTEFGWGSFENIASAPPPGVEYMAQVTEWEQAVYTLRAFELGQMQQLGGPMFLWNLNFGPLLGTDFAESGYSVLQPDGRPRPVYSSLATAVKK
ncbi:MAG: cellulase family glycosylhydrolase [Chloroflexi bacterium]|nr:cellulase family glycosylhydrolase [Chloroflexota bacterium]